MEVTPDLMETFKRTYLTNGLHEEQVAKIVDLAQVQIYLAQEVILKRGDPPQHLYVILAGRVDLLTGDQDKLAQLGPGNLIGEVAVLSNHPSDFDAVCEGITRVAHISIAQLRALMNEDRNLGFMVLANIGALLCNRLHSASAVMHHLHESDAWEGSY